MGAVDHHCHPLALWPLNLTGRGLRAVFTEALAPQLLDHHVPATVTYQDAIRRLALELRCEPTEEAVLQARAREDAIVYANRLLQRTGTGMMLLDTGFTEGGPFSFEKHQSTIQVPQREIVRLERLAELALAQSSTPRDWYAAVRSALRAAVQKGAVGVKTVAAYRAGLRLGPVPTMDLNRAFAAVQAEVHAGRPGRISGKALTHSLLFEAAEECLALQVPLQVHCGFGDNDEDLADCSPLGLRPLLVDARYDGLRLILLHCYPYHREAAYLCGVFPNVYMDLSLSLPLAGLDGKRAVREALGLCPWTKLLYASDASRLPELFFVAAAVHREALASAFAEFVDGGVLNRDQAVAAGVRVLAGNAQDLYSLA